MAHMRRPPRIEISDPRVRADLERRLWASCGTSLMRRNTRLYNEVHARVSGTPLARFLPHDIAADFAALQISQTRSALDSSLLATFQALQVDDEVIREQERAFVRVVVDGLIKIGMSWNELCAALYPDFGRHLIYSEADFLWQFPELPIGFHGFYYQKFVDYHQNAKERAEFGFPPAPWSIGIPY